MKSLEELLWEGGSLSGNPNDPDDPNLDVIESSPLFCIVVCCGITDPGGGGFGCQVASNVPGPVPRVCKD